MSIDINNDDAHIIAEIGHNHQGSLEKALQLVKMAKDAGADSVKFQKRDIDTVYTQEYLDSARQSPWGTTQRHQKVGLEFDKEEYDNIYIPKCVNYSATNKYTLCLYPV